MVFRAGPSSSRFIERSSSGCSSKQTMPVRYQLWLESGLSQSTAVSAVDSLPVGHANFQNAIYEKPAKQTGHLDDRSLFGSNATRDQSLPFPNRCNLHQSHSQPEGLLSKLKDYRFLLLPIASPNAFDPIRTAAEPSTIPLELPA